ncbi:MMPL family transporter [Phytohabitans rumicis]|uniref:MMPL family transporter n=1 Tax=Phytohabitans rumicis TaxID=1076125 RepID=UPI0031E5E62D
MIGAWLVILAGLLLARATWGGDFANDYTVPGTESQRGADVLKKEFPAQSGNAGQVVFAAAAGKQVSAASDAINQAMGNVGKLDHVLSAVSPFAAANSPLVAKDGAVAYGTVNFDVVTNTLEQDYLDQFDAAVQPARAAGLQVEYGGAAGQIGQRTEDLNSEVLGLACALLLLIFMFGSVVAAAIPLLSAVFSVMAGLSVLGLLAAAFTFPTTAPTVATLLGLGVAVDYGLFLVARHRESLDAGLAPVDAAGASNATSGSAIIVAGSTVVIAILGLFVAGVPFVSAMGTAAAVVVAITMLVSLTLVPAFLGVARGNVRSLRERLAERRARRAGGALPDRAAREQAHEHSAFARWGRMVSSHPWPWGIAALVILGLLAVPLFSIRFGQVDAGTDPTSQTDRRAYDLIASGFGPGANGPLTVVVSLPSGQSSTDTQNTLSSLQQTLAKTAGVASVSTPQVNQAGTTAVLNVIPTTGPQDAATTDLVGDIRDDVLPPTKLTTYVTGSTAGNVDFTDRVVSRMPLLIAAVVFLALLLLTAAFRSLSIGLKAAAMNLLSVAAAYGVVVAVFQWGWGSSLVGVDETVPIPAFVPMLMFAIIFGLSTDYEVFLLSRVHEAYLSTKDSHRSVAIGIGSTARVITTAAAIMIVVFTSFVIDPDPTVKMLAVGMAASVLIDASIVRMVLVPSVMSILGDRAWWIPRWLAKILPRLDIEGADIHPPTPKPAIPVP